MIRGAIRLDDVFDSLAPMCDLSKSLVFSRTNTILPSLAAGLKYSIAYSRAFSAVYDWNGRALSKDLVCFQRFVYFVVRFLYGFRTFDVKSKKGIRRLFGNDTAVVLSDLARIQNDVQLRVLTL